MEKLAFLGGLLFIGPILGEGFDTICCRQMVPLITPDLLMIKLPASWK
jgi:hypothetical protein